VIPLKDLNRTTRRPYVTVALILINVAVFVFVQQAQHGERTVNTSVGPVPVPASTAFELEHAAIPCEVVHDRPLTFAEIGGASCGARSAAGSPKLFPHKNVLVAVFVSMFLHASWVHLLGNMLFLWIFGNNVEDRLGPVWFPLFYFVGGIAATSAYVAVNTSSTAPLLGASGAIAAVMGAYLVWFPGALILTIVVIVPVLIPAVALLLYWFVVQFFTDPGSGVAWVAHVGGFLFGALVGLVVGRPPRAAGPTFRRRPPTLGGWRWA
jgi:membrane associated rhomboid family serine protease